MMRQTNPLLLILLSLSKVTSSHQTVLPSCFQGGCGEMGEGRLTLATKLISPLRHTMCSRKSPLVSHSVLTLKSRLWRPENQEITLPFASSHTSTCQMFMLSVKKQDDLNFFLKSASGEWFLKPPPPHSPKSLHVRKMQPPPPPQKQHVDSFGPVVWCWVDRPKDLPAECLNLSFVSPFCGHSPATLPCRIYQIAKWLTSLPIFMQCLFWWWGCNT